MKGYYAMFRSKADYIRQVMKDMKTEPKLKATISEILQDEIAAHTYINRTFVLDMVTITLGRLGWKPNDFKRFRDEFLVAENDYAHLGVKDSKDDPEIVYTKKKLDDALLDYVGEEMYIPFEKRYEI